MKDLFSVRTVQLCINNNICNDGCKMSNYIAKYENNMCMYIYIYGTISISAQGMMHPEVSN